MALYFILNVISVAMLSDIVQKLSTRLSYDELQVKFD